MSSDKTILAYASQYAEKYFINNDLGKLPENVKKEIIGFMVYLTEEAGGVAELGFTDEGEVYLDSYCEEGDLGYDNISAGLIIREIERDHRELFDQLALWNRTRSGLL